MRLRCRAVVVFHIIRVGSGGVSPLRLEHGHVSPPWIGPVQGGCKALEDAPLLTGAAEFLQQPDAFPPRQPGRGLLPTLAAHPCQCPGNPAKTRPSSRKATAAAGSREPTLAEAEASASCTALLAGRETPCGCLICGTAADRPPSDGFLSVTGARTCGTSIPGRRWQGSWTRLRGHWLAQRGRAWGCGRVGCGETVCPSRRPATDGLRRSPPRSAPRSASAG